MNKQELTIVVVLFVALMGWMFLFSPRATPGANPGSAAGAGTNAQSRVEQSAPPAPAMTNAVAAAAGTNHAPSVVSSSAGAASNAVVTTGSSEPAEAPALNVSDAPARFYSIGNDALQLTLSSKGGGISSAELLKFRETLDEDSDNLVMDFEGLAPLSMENIPGLGSISDFKVETASDGSSALITAEVDGRYRFERIIVVGEDYTLAVTDRVVNVTSAPISLDEWQIAAGQVGSLSTNGVDASLLSIDSYGYDASEEEVGVIRWQKQLPALFGATGGGCSRSVVSPNAPAQASMAKEMPAEWIAPKSKFFTLMLQPTEPAAGAVLSAWRESSLRNEFKLIGVGASLILPEVVVEPAGSVERSYVFYVGPKSYSRLKALGAGQETIMDWGIFRVICRVLLPTLVGIHKVVPNWGLAIILLTFLVRGIFWPITHKSTESMKRMQEIQPQIKALREKYKSQPQVLQQETMKLYKEHKVNPLASCLPMLIQIPVFIALFTVLRSSVEMRHAWFLWINDLSEPENIPFFGYSLNLLPIVMAGTMAWQQALTPSTGDQQQKKMMMVMMPLMMLFMLYKMPSALMLYWSTSQVVSIVQLYWQRHRQHQKDAAKAEVIVEPPRETRQMRRRKEK